MPIANAVQHYIDPNVHDTIPSRVAVVLEQQLFRLEAFHSKTY
jgi:hypothetical protein